MTNPIARLGPVCSNVHLESCDRLEAAPASAGSAENALPLTGAAGKEH
jgi:hypothetical protein